VQASSVVTGNNERLLSIWKVMLAGVKVADDDAAVAVGLMLTCPPEVYPLPGFVILAEQIVTVKIP